MKHLFAAFAILAFTAGTAFSQHNTWSLFSSKDANVQALFPGKPELKTTVDKGATHYEALVELEDNAFILSTDKPFPATPTEAQKKRAYDGGRDELLKTFPGSKLISERDMYIDGRFGREIVVHTTAFYMMYRFFVDNGVFYGAGVVAALAKKDDPKLQADSNKFLDSFQVFRAP